MSKPKILIVDDNPVTLSLMRDTLELEESCKVLTTSDPHEALQLCREHLPDLVLMDLQMPRMDGYEVTRLIKADPTTRNIPVVALTASRLGVEDMSRAMQAGCEGYLQKPVPRSLLLETVQKYLYRRPAR